MRDDNRDYTVRRIVVAAECRRRHRRRVGRAFHGVDLLFCAVRTRGTAPAAPAAAGQVSNSDRVVKRTENPLVSENQKCPSARILFEGTPRS